MNVLSPVLVFNPIAMYLCTSERDFEAVQKAEGFVDDDGFLAGGALGSTALYHLGDRAITVVSLRVSPEAVSVLVHESVHVWQNYVMATGEKDPSREFEAYSIEGIFSTLYKEYQKAERRYNMAAKKKGGKGGKKGC